MNEQRKIVGFKKFSEFKNESKIEEIDPALDMRTETDEDIPMHHNLPKETTKEESPASTKNLKPKVEEEKVDENAKVRTYGKVAKFPKNVKASKAYGFLESIKTSKESVWYIITEKMDDELQVVKYNYNEGVDLDKFVKDLKAFYIDKNKGNKEALKLIEGIHIEGCDKWSRIVNIPALAMNGKTMVAQITEDLIKLLSK